MLTCAFEDGNKASLRHVVTDNILVRDEEILLVKRRSGLVEGGKWSLVGGFMDRGETIPEAAKREIKEETGYEVQDITLLRIIDRPDRPNDWDRQNVSFVHFCTAGEKTGKPDDESTEQRWFRFDNLPHDEQIAFDHFENILLYLKYRQEKFPLPLLPQSKN